MRIAQIAPLDECVPPRLGGGTERVVSFLTEELVRLEQPTSGGSSKRYRRSKVRDRGSVSRRSTCTTSPSPSG
jgi:hypothetical protein